MATQHPSTFKVALIQLHPKVNDPETNFKAATEYIRAAAEQGASLAVLPEYHLTGWDPESPEFVCIAASASDYVTRYQKLASKLNINIVPGTIVQKVSGDETSKPVLHNIAPFISSTGELLGSYVKQNLWHPERPHLSPAFKKAEQQHPRAVESPPSPHSVIETPLGPVGLLVCWDIGFPEAFRSLVRQGARIIICPTFWLNTDMSAEGLKINPDAEGVFVRSIIPARACENTCCIIFVNGGGPKEEGFLGLSQVALPIVGTLEGSFTDCEQGMRTLEVDMKIVDVAEANYKIREDLGREDWHYGYSHERS